MSSDLLFNYYSTRPCPRVKNLQHQIKKKKILRQSPRVIHDDMHLSDVFGSKVADVVTGGLPLVAIKTSRGQVSRCKGFSVKNLFCLITEYQWHLLLCHLDERAERPWDRWEEYCSRCIDSSALLFP